MSRPTPEKALPRKSNSLLQTRNVPVGDPRQNIWGENSVAAVAIQAPRVIKSFIKWEQQAHGTEVGSTLDTFSAFIGKLRNI